MPRLAGPASGAGSSPARTDRVRRLARWRLGSIRLTCHPRAGRDRRPERSWRAVWRWRTLHGRAAGGLVDPVQVVHHVIGDVVCRVGIDHRVGHRGHHRVGVASRDRLVGDLDDVGHLPPLGDPRDHGLHFLVECGHRLGLAGREITFGRFTSRLEPRLQLGHAILVFLEVFSSWRQLRQDFRFLLGIGLDLLEIALACQRGSLELLAGNLHLIVALEDGVHIDRPDHGRDWSRGCCRRGTGRPANSAVLLLTEGGTHQKAKPHRTEPHRHDRTRGNDHRYNSFSTAGSR